MRIYFYLGFTLFLCACGSDGGSNNTYSSLPPPSSAIYDFRNYTSDTPEETEINGFWLVFSRYNNDTYYETIDMRQKGYFEVTKLISIYQLPDGDIQVTDPDNIINPQLIPTPWIDTDKNTIITWGESLSGGYYNLTFNGSTLMKGKISNSHHELLDEYTDVKTYENEVYAVKMTSFPSGKFPDAEGNIELDSSIFGELNFDIETIGSVLPADYIDLSTSGYITYYNRMHFTGQIILRDIKDTLDVDSLRAISHFNNGYQYIEIVKANSGDFLNCSRASVYFTDNSNPISKYSTCLEISDLAYSISMGDTFEDSTASFYVTDETENHLISGDINLDLTAYLVAP